MNIASIQVVQVNPGFVVQPVGAEYDPFVLKHLRFYANLYHSDLEKGYIPHAAAAVAQIIADNLRAEIVHIEMPTGPPSEPDRVY